MNNNLNNQYRKELQDALDAVIAHDSLTEASNELGIPRTTLKDRFDSAVKQHFQPNADALKSAGIKIPINVPFSEDEEKYKKWTPLQCIDELKRIVKANPKRVISRNHFRVFSSISESTWNKHFGTFHEFKRQAGIVLSRHVHMHEKHVAKHAAHDKQRDLNTEKRNYEGKYDKPHDERWQSILVGSDIHDKECDPFWRRVFLSTAARMQPDIICLNGDIFDLAEFGKFTIDPREWDVTGRIMWVHTFLREIRNICPNAQIDFVEGNHEFRLLRHLAEATPAMRAVLADLHGFTVSKLLGLDEFELNYIARMDLAAWRETDITKELRANYVNYWDALIGHHFPYGRQMGLPGWNGHNHKHVVWDGYSPIHGAFEWHQIGCGHRRLATFTQGEKWANGFLTVHCDTHTKTSVFDYSQITDHAVTGGKWYTRAPAEIVIKQGNI